MGREPLAKPQGTGPGAVLAGQDANPGIGQHHRQRPGKTDPAFHLSVQASLLIARHQHQALHRQAGGDQPLQAKQQARVALAIVDIAGAQGVVANIHGTPTLAHFTPSSGECRQVIAR
ncbi:hypothetical protein D3C75_1032020 [compost metagenome]